MSDSVLVALITTAGSVAVAYLTVVYGNKPKHDDTEIKRELEELEELIKEKKDDDK